MIRIYNYSNEVIVTVETNCEETIKGCNGMIWHKVPALPYTFKAHFQNDAMECLLEYKLSKYQITPLVLTKDEDGIKNIKVKNNDLIMRYVENHTLFIFEGVIEKDGENYDA